MVSGLSSASPAPQNRPDEPHALRVFPPLPGLLVFALWIGAEIVVFNLVAGWVGGGFAFFLLVMKSVFGLVFIKRAVTRKLFDILRRRGAGFVLEGASATEAWLKGLGAALLAAPGFVTGLAGLALLTPSVRRWLIARSGARPVNPREIELSADEWRDISRRGARRLRPGPAERE
jgi:UPF0716 protein FxsA